MFTGGGQLLIESAWYFALLPLLHEFVYSAKHSSALSWIPECYSHQSGYSTSGSQGAPRLNRRSTPLSPTESMLRLTNAGPVHPEGFISGHS